MARAKEQASYWGSFASAALYKKNQGRLTRQLTALGLAAILGLGCWVMTQTVLSGAPDWWNPDWGLDWSYARYGIPAILIGVGLWAIYRLVNYARFADFLISVEAEMDKVSWADQTYLIRATGVVLTTMLVITGYLLVCDFIWARLFRAIGFLRLE